jgi:hypothetical protein
MFNGIADDTDHHPFDGNFEFGGANSELFE